MLHLAAPELAALAAHITGGTLAIGSGWVAVLAPKGGRLHRTAGTVFFGAMILMATMAIYLSVVLHERSNFAAGIFALYFTATAWMAARRRDGAIGWFEVAALLAVLGVAAMFFSWGALAARQPHGLDGAPPSLFYVFGAMASLFALLDIKTIWSGGLSGAARIARHLWRMCFAFFFASASFFIGQQKVMPKAWHGSPILLVLGLAPLAFLVFWMIKVRWTGRKSRPAAASA
jgi:hypothetical protein